VSDGTTESILVATDGGARGNPGPAAIGAVVYDTTAEPPLRLFTVSERIGTTTNNVAEYQAVVRGLEVAAPLHARRVHVRADSQLLIRQLEGTYRVKSPGLRPLYDRARELLADYDEVVLEHVPREENVEADTLVNAALDLPD
jgi:ribonuclease HI